jgi:hypothetical protein
MDLFTGLDDPRFDGKGLNIFDPIQFPDLGNPFQMGGDGGCFIGEVRIKVQDLDVGTKSGDLVGYFILETGDNGHRDHHHSQAKRDPKNGNAHNGMRETASGLSAADHAAYDKEFGIQGFLIQFIKSKHLLLIFAR